MRSVTKNLLLFLQAKVSTSRVKVPLCLSAILAVALASSAGSFYNFDIVATSGASGLGAINQEVSINDTGRVAFIGRQGSANVYSSVWVADGNGILPRSINPSFSGSSRVFSFPQINNSGQVIACESINGFIVRTWNTESGAWTQIQQNAGTGYAHNMLTLSSVSNDGYASYIGFFGDYSG